MSISVVLCPCWDLQWLLIPDFTVTLWSFAGTWLSQLLVTFPQKRRKRWIWDVTPKPHVLRSRAFERRLVQRGCCTHYGSVFRAECALRSWGLLIRKLSLGEWPGRLISLPDSSFHALFPGHHDVRIFPPLKPFYHPALAFEPADHGLKSWTNLNFSSFKLQVLGVVS